MASTYLVSAPAREPVTLAEAKLHLRIETDVTADDDRVRGCISAARAYAEDVLLWRGLVDQTWEWVGEDFPADEFELPRGKLSSVTWVKYLDEDGAQQTLASSTYDVDTTTTPGWLRLAYDQDWPTSLRGTWQDVRIRYVVGDAFAATGTVTISASLTAGEKVTIAGVDFTARSANPAANEFLIGADATADAAALAAAIEESTSGAISGVVSASSSSGVVTVSADAVGTAGNTITLARTGAHFAVSGSTLTGGTDVPPQAKQGLLLLISHFYEHRTDELVGTIVSRFQLAAKDIMRGLSLKGF